MAIRILVNARLTGRLWAVSCVVALLASCGAPPYSNFYRRYAGTCDKTQAQPQPSAAYIPNLTAIQREFIQSLDEHEAEVRQCYSDALRYGETHGTIQLAIALEPDGQADPVTVSADSTTFAPLSCCVVSVVKSIRFKPTGERTNVSFEYPFSFRTLRMPDTQSDTGATWFRSAALKDRFIVELDEQSVAIGGLFFYPVASDRIHHASDTGDETTDAGPKTNEPKP